MKTVKLIENQGRPLVLTQADGKTFRLGPWESTTLDESLMSPEFYAAKDAGVLVILEEATKTTKTGTTTQTSTSTDKGGTK